METAIIIDGLSSREREREREHGLRCMRFTVDGDSLAYLTLLTTVPAWGRAIEKMECTYYACKW